MAHKPDRFRPDSRAARILAALLAFLAWQAGALLLHNSLLLVGPWEVLIRLAELGREASFWKALTFSCTRISLGFLLGFGIAFLLAALSARFPLVKVLLRPWFLAVQTIPVASFIVIALLWLSGRRLSIFIAFLMVLPVLYANMLQGFLAADAQLLEMARVFRMPTWNRVRCIRLPAARPYILAGCRSALGLCWKAGVAAEVIAVCNGSIGGMLYDAKVYLEITDLFAWTLVIVLVSMLLEWAFTRLLRAILGLLEGTGWRS